MTNTAARLSTLETEVSSIRTDVTDMKAMLTAYLAANAPAKSEPLTVTFAREEKARDERVSKARKARKPVSEPKSPAVRKALAEEAKSRNIAWTGTRTDRKRWNDTFAALTRLSGLRDKRDVTLYRVGQNRWAEVSQMRQDGLTPAQAVEAVMGTKKWHKAA